jgi:hypothetical protein
MFVAQRRAARKREAQRIGAVIVDDAERVDDVALRLRHLRRPSRRGRVGGCRRPETGIVFHEMEAHHHHTATQKKMMSKPVTRALVG